MRGTLLATVSGLSLILLYGYGLDRMGIYGPDEPRYASIGREMSRSGDFITPRLWGDPWFEKPALLYWMVAAGFRAGLSADLAPRLPVALMSVAFLIAFFYLVRRQFGMLAATYSTAILATSAWWMAYSHVSVTDLPMSAAFALAMLFAIEWIGSGDRKWLNFAAAALAVSVLAKGLVPMVLAVPALWFGRTRWRDLLRPIPILIFLVIAVPWYAACTARNGVEFLKIFFLVHHFERVTSTALQHVQPIWFYIPMLLAALFPWTPLLALLFRRQLYTDVRLRFFLATAIWGLVFFSIPVNKLPGYILPLLPALAILAGVALEKAGPVARWAVTASGLCCLAFPILVMRLPVLLSGKRDAAVPSMPIALVVAVLLVTVSVAFVRTRVTQVAMVALLASAGYVWIKAESYPFVDRAATVRPVWRELDSTKQIDSTCAGNVPRGWRYGLNYYTVTPLPDCQSTPSRPIQLNEQNRALVVTRR